VEVFLASRAANSRWHAAVVVETSRAEMGLNSRAELGSGSWSDPINWVSVASFLIQLGPHLTAVVGAEVGDASPMLGLQREATLVVGAEGDGTSKTLCP
jgi:hypothetical protein